MNGIPEDTSGTQVLVKSDARKAEEQRAREVLALIVAYRENVLPAFETFVAASSHVQAYIEAGCPTDAQSVRSVGPHVFDALRALTFIGDGARRVTGVAAQSVGVIEAHLRELN